MKITLIAGIDVGSRTTKAVLINEAAEIVARYSSPTSVRLDAVGETAIKSLCPNGKKPSYVASTGYGRYQVKSRDIQITEITCHAYGAHFLYPKTKCVLDIGAQNSRAIKILDNGRVKTFKMNDKCASGAGRFLERVAQAMELELEQIGEMSLRSADPQTISSICAVLAESEIINHVTEGKKIEDILMGAHKSIIDRVTALIRQVGVESEVTMTGGVAKNVGMVKAFEEKIGMKVNVHKDSEYAGAIGAALLGLRRLQKQTANN